MVSCRRICLICIGFAVVCGCGKRNEPVVVKGKPVAHWVKELKSPSAQTRKQAAFNLGLVGTMDGTALPALTQALKDEDTEVRRTAVLSLLHMGPAARDAVPALEQAQNDADEKVRSYAAKALKKINP